MRAGSQLESPEEHGIVDLVSKLSFQATSKRSPQDFIDKLTSMGGSANVLTSRDSVLWGVTALRASAQESVELLLETVFEMEGPDSVLEDAKELVRREQEFREGDTWVMELLHGAAYGPTTRMGHSVTCQVEAMDTVTWADIRAFMDREFRADRTVITAASAEWEATRATVEKCVGGLPKLAPETASSVAPPEFVSGQMLDPQMESEFTHVAVGFETPGGWSRQEDVFALCVLQALLGGGSSFSAGGPGKGMYTRLYDSALRRYGWIESINGSFTGVDTSGMMVISGSCIPDSAPRFAAVAMQFLATIADKPVSGLELDRAKNMLIGMVLSNLEFRSLVAEDIFRQLSSFGRREVARETREKIASVTAADIQRVAQAYVQKPPAVAACGPGLSSWPGAEVIWAAVSGQSK